MIFKQNAIFCLYINQKKIGIFTSHTLIKFLFGQKREYKKCYSMVYEYARFKRKIKSKHTVLDDDCHVRFASDNDITVLAGDTFYLFDDSYNKYVYDSFKSFADNLSERQLTSHEKKTKYSNSEYIKWLEQNNTEEPHSIKFKRFIKQVK